LKKSKAFDIAPQKLISEDKPRCFHDCSGNGECQPAPQGSAAERFHHETCMRDKNFSRPACATPVILTAPTSSILSILFSLTVTKFSNIL
jgi:hypothetical protein